MFPVGVPEDWLSAEPAGRVFASGFAFQCLGEVCVLLVVAALDWHCLLRIMLAMGLREWRERQIVKADARVARADAKLAELKARQKADRESRETDVLQQWYEACARVHGVDHEAMVRDSVRFGVALPEPRKAWLVERMRNGAIDAMNVVPGARLAGAVGAGVATMDGMGAGSSQGEPDPYGVWLQVLRAERLCAEYTDRGERVPAAERALLRGARFMHKHQGKVNAAGSAIRSLPI